MLDDLELIPLDHGYEILRRFKADTNPSKINTYTGVFRDDQARCLVMSCVKEAERRVIELESSKDYLDPAGSREFQHAVIRLLFGTTDPASVGDRAQVFQTPGGTAALRIVGEVSAELFSRSRVWVSDPTWPNHLAIFEAARLPARRYQYGNQSTWTLELDSVLATLEDATPGDIVLWHAGCHNPTGINPAPADWKRIARFMKERSLLPLFDLAFFGWVEGLEKDLAWFEIFRKELGEFLVAISFSKAFHLYRERVGALCVLGRTPDAATAFVRHARRFARPNYSTPPSHGAAIVSTVLREPELRTQWEDELDSMRARVREMRTLLKESLETHQVPGDFSGWLKQSGIFAPLRLTRDEADRLEKEYSVYLSMSGWLNVVSLSKQEIPHFSKAVADVLRY